MIKHVQEFILRTEIICLFNVCIYICACVYVCPCQVAVRDSAVGRGGREAEGKDGGWPNCEELTHTQSPTHSLWTQSGLEYVSNKLAQSSSIRKKISHNFYLWLSAMNNAFPLLMYL